ncbi:hypothetical protein [Shinella sp. BYT-45]|uniref:hypothetical protein n=1 Tax=Shinella sp. BYT-45 TaxID=3377377 RepID=UPI00397F6405
MRSISTRNLAAIQAGRIIARDFLWIRARTIDTGALSEHGFWSDAGNVSAPVLNPNTGLSETRNFEGSGTLISISDISLVANLTVQDVTIEMSQLDPASEAIVRGYDLRQAGVEIYRGLYNPATRQLVAPALCRFVGFVDEAPIETPEEAGVGKITLVCKSHTQEMTRSNADTRSDASQRRRSATDNFYQDVTTIGEVEFFWGKKSGKLGSAG